MISLPVLIQILKNTVLTPWVEKTGAYSLVNQDRILANSSSGPFSLTLPSSPTVGDYIVISDSEKTFDTNNVTLIRNGSLIDGSASNLVMSIEGVLVELVYIGGSVGWRNIAHYRNTDTSLDVGGVNEISASTLKIHTDNTTKHREINDSSTAVTDLWSASKIFTQLAAKAASAHVHATSDLSPVGSNGTFVKSNGASADWSAITVTDLTSVGANKTFVRSNGSTAAWATLVVSDLSSVGSNGTFVKSNGTVASWASIAHSDLTGIGVSDHHVRYADSEAIAAINAQAYISPNIRSNIDLTSSLGSNSTYRGIFDTKTLTPVAVFGQALHIDTNGQFVLADASSTTTMPCSSIAIEAGSGSRKVLYAGYVRYDTWNWTPGGLIYVSENGGDFTQTAPTTSGSQVQVVGVALTADIIYFNPSFVLVEVV